MTIAGSRARVTPESRSKSIFTYKTTIEHDAIHVVISTRIRTTRNGENATVWCIMKIRAGMIVSMIPACM